MWMSRCGTGGDRCAVSAPVWVLIMCREMFKSSLQSFWSVDSGEWFSKCWCQVIDELWTQILPCHIFCVLLSLLLAVGISLSVIAKCFLIWFDFFFFFAHIQLLCDDGDISHWVRGSSSFKQLMQEARVIHSPSSSSIFFTPLNIFPLLSPLIHDWVNH